SVIVKATDAAGNATTSPATITWSYWIPPETTLDSSGPSGTVSQTTGTFTFTSPAATGFECKLDTGAWTTCSSPYTTPVLANGSHTVSIRAVKNGVPDATVATRTWTVDTSAVPLQPVTGSTLAAGPLHACAVATGKMYCWGDNGAGQLGDGTSSPRTTPLQTGAATDWASVSVGLSHTCALRNSGALYCWGGNGYGQLGSQDPTYYFGSSSPVWCWGSNGSGELGNGSFSYSAVTVPTQVGTNTNWVDVDGGYGFTCALNASGAMYCWGDGSAGQLGVGSTAGFFGPMTAAATNVASISVGSEYACAAKKNGSLWCWGQNTTFQGGNSVTDRTIPSQVGIETDWKSVDAGIIHTCAIKTNGALWCWGDQTNNALGNGISTAMQMTPLQIGISTDWSAVSCNNGSPGFSGGYCIGMRNTAVYSWGDNGASQCGTNGMVTPVVAPAGTDYMLQLTPFP
ncbi:MAG: hypothetical protein H0U59_03955, partial [Gemmatimonadaceae bacterium]|nr:hypothetical protein [Gemmatimonadaceae bacterium]